MPNYGDASYWEDRYKSSENTTFDWLENYSALKDIISSLNISKETGQILNLGCGNSEFSEHMYADGYRNIKNIDISHNVIKSMSERNKDKKEMTYEVMDVRDLKYEDNKFTFTVRGFGHGVGMSQYGAYYMANKGSNYKRILNWYYKGCTIK